MTSLKSTDYTKESCELCKKNSDLKNSHIIPEFLYKTLYDEKHKLYLLSTLKDGANDTLQKGLREKLLCGDCEERLSKWERYASLVLNGGAKYEFRKEGNIIEFRGISYDKFKLFQLSILWRASIAKHPLFRNVNLNHHQEKIRIMLINETPGEPEDYPCIMYGLLSEGQPVTDIIDQPDRVKIDTHNGICFTFGGFSWNFIVSSHPISENLKKAALNKDQLLIFLQELKDIPHLLFFWKKIKEMGREPPEPRRAQ